MSSAPGPWPGSVDSDLARIALRRAKEGARGQRFSGHALSTRQPVRRPGRVPPVLFGHVLLEVLSRDTLFGPRGAALLTQWPSVAGPLARHMSPAGFEAWSSTLTLHCDSDAWLTQGKLLQDALLRRLNDALGDGSVHRLRFKKAEQLHRPIPLTASPSAPGRLRTLPPQFPDQAIEAACQLHDQGLPREPA